MGVDLFRYFVGTMCAQSAREDIPLRLVAKGLLAICTHNVHTNMAKVSMLKIRVCPRKKQQFRKIVRSCGLTMSAALSLFIQKTINNQAIPFDIKAKGAEEEEPEFDTMEEWRQWAIRKTAEELGAEGLFD